MKIFYLFLTSFFLSFIFIAICFFLYRIYIRFRIKKDRWSIGIYTGISPLHLKPPKQIKNPVLTAQDIRDIDAQFIADPFIIKEKSNWYIFFEILNKSNQKGEIGYAISEDGFHWRFQQIILAEPFHLSYPQVFKWENEYYMIPESHRANSIRLYKATLFPIKWRYEKTLLEKMESDASIFFYSGKWWMFTVNHFTHQLNLYYTDRLYGPWSEHPKNPLISNNKHISRPGGRVTFFNGKIIRFTQDDWLIYGNKVRAFEITKLTDTEYEEKLICKEPIISKSGVGWNRNGMHHIDPLQIDHNLWIAAVDGFGME